MARRRRRRGAAHRSHAVVGGGGARQEAAQHVDAGRPAELRGGAGAQRQRRRHAVVSVVAVVVVQLVRGRRRRGRLRVRGEQVRAAAERGRDGVRVLALVRGDHHRRVLVRPLHPLLHRALLRRAPVVAPGVWAVLDGLLAVLAPPVAVLEVVDLALGHEREPRLPRPLLPLPRLPSLRRRPAPIQSIPYYQSARDRSVRFSASKAAEFRMSSGKRRPRPGSIPFKLDRHTRLRERVCTQG
jgi:hypothetical protein